MKVKYLDLQKQFDDEALWTDLKKQFQSCMFVMGNEVRQFESAFAELCQTRFALGVNSGTDAIFLALKALDIGQDDEVLTVSNSFIATAGAIVATGAKPVFVDAVPDYNMNPELIEGAITPRTRAIMPVHLTGNPADMPRIMDIAKAHGLYVVEDAAQAVAATIHGQPVGSFGDVGCFSLHPLKNLNVCGDGGVLTTNSKDLHQKIERLRNHGLKNRDEIAFFGYNSRLDTIQAVVALHNLKNLHQVTEKRIGNAKKYDSLLSEMNHNVVIPPRRTDVRQVFHTYIVQVKEREKLIEHLDTNGVETKIHYPIPIHLQEPCREIGLKSGGLPETEKQGERILSLPIHQFLTPEQIEYVAESIKRFYA
jgi:dTDP-4-amino-4,6-dideoxygalactose transaminase